MNNNNTISKNNMNTSNNISKNNINSNNNINKNNMNTNNNLNNLPNLLSFNKQPNIVPVFFAQNQSQSTPL